MMPPDAFTAPSSLRDGFSADDLGFEPIIPLLPSSRRPATG